MHTIHNTSPALASTIPAPPRARSATTIPAPARTTPAPDFRPGLTAALWGLCTGAAVAIVVLALIFGGN
jgi:hypothetical protein